MVSYLRQQLQPDGCRCHDSHPGRNDATSQKFFGWLKLETDVPLVTTTGNQRIYAFDHGDKSNGPVGLRLKSGNGEYTYWGGRRKKPKSLEPQRHRDTKFFSSLPRLRPADKKGFLCALVSLWFNAFLLLRHPLGGVSNHWSRGE